MTAVARSIVNEAVPAQRVLPPFPSAAALALENSTWSELEKVFLRGTTPDVESLIGWEFRGMNTRLFRMRHTARLVGLKKFCKGFYRDTDGRTMGYNSPVAQNVLDGRWRIAPKKFGFYQVDPVDPTSRDNEYLHALLLDYGRGGNKPYDVSRGLRDYLVQLEDDLYLGKAYYRIGPMCVASNFFIIERHRVGLTDYARR
jgi:hypothetical protein